MKFGDLQMVRLYRILQNINKDKKMRYLAFEEARTYVRNQKLENTRAWKKWSKGILEGKERRPDFIPASPDIVYKNSGWLSWSEFKRLY